jgi:Flp pilus assembly protein CpaB
LSVTVGPGELIQSSMLSLAGGSSGLRPVSVTVDANSLSGLAPGDSVDVLATASNPDGSTQVSVVMRGASLISVSQPSSNLLSGSTSGPLVTLGVGNLAEVEAVVAAAHGGTLELVEAEPSDGVGAGPGPTGTPISSPPTS